MNESDNYILFIKLKKKLKISYEANLLKVTITINGRRVGVNSSVQDIASSI